MCRLTRTVFAGVFATTLAVSGTSTVAAAEQPEPVTLPGCAVVFAPQAGSQEGAECLQRVDESASERSAGHGPDGCGYGHGGGHGSGHGHGHGHGHGCGDGHSGGHGHGDGHETRYVVVTEHGPWGSQAQRRGWELYFVEPGLYYVPGRFNDEASAWGAFGFCGFFHVHDPGTRPSAFFPKNRAGNFPYGNVGNDQLSGVSVFKHCS